MLEPLDPEKLRALTVDDDNADCLDIRAAKSSFAKDDFAGGMEKLFQIFDLWTPRLYRDKNHHTYWHIQFRVCSPFYTSFNTHFDRRILPLTPSIYNPAATASRYSVMTSFLLHMLS